MPYYHCTHSEHTLNDIIQPGNWGRIIRDAGLSHSHWFREIILEAIRLQYYPAKPSRLFSTFCCDSLDTINFYKQHNNPKGFIYQVEYVDAEPLIHKSDFNTVEPLPYLPYNMVDIAHVYWQYLEKTSVEGWQGIEFSEFVSPSAIRVVRKLNK